MTSYIYNMVDTWALSGGPYTSIKMNATDNDSASASLLMDLQIGGASKFRLTKSGTIEFNAGTTEQIWSPSSQRVSINANGIFTFTGGGGYASSVGGIGFRSSTLAGSDPDTILSRKAAANLRFGGLDAAAPTAQTLSAQSVVAGTTNTAGTSLTITGSQGTGTGAGGSIIFQVAPAGSTGSAQNALATALTIASNLTTTFGGNVAFSANEFISYSTSRLFATAGGSVCGTFVNSGLAVSSLGFLGFRSSTSGAADADVALLRDAANTLALRNGTAAQEMRVYETTTGTIYKAILGNRQLIKIAGAAFDNGAGASAGTLTNAPAVGNPTKWIPIDDNGTTRHIPAW